jgi:hypothetical protein
MRRNLLYEDWSTPGAHPAMITDRHIGSFEANEKVRLDDVYGDGELLFVRKFADDNLDLLQRIDNLIVRKESSEPVSDTHQHV